MCHPGGARRCHGAHPTGRAGKTWSGQAEKKKKNIRAESEAAGPREGHLAEPGLLSVSVSLRLSLSQQELQAFFNLKQRNVRWMDVWEDWGNFGNTSRTYESCNPRRDCLRAGLRLDEAGEGPAQAVPGEWAGLACLTLVTGLLSGSVWPVLVRGCWRWQVALSGIP